ncbi:MAG: peptidase S10 [Acidobacteria bacterium]|nr:peptidase S10 [Acidobacteriota bacterium]
MKIASRYVVACVVLASLAKAQPPQPAQNRSPRQQPAQAQPASPESQSQAPNQEQATTPPARRPESQVSQPPAAQAQQRPAQPEPAAMPGPGGAGGGGAAFHFDMTEVPPVQTHHSIRVGGRELNYTATAGRLPIKDAEGRIEAEMFFAAYTLDGADPGTRPVTFAYNGGPGSASVWLHMGALGPKKIFLEPGGFMPHAPYRFVDNPYTPLDRSDLVLVDAIGTGYSRPADNAAARKYENPTGDVEAFAEFIRMYISRYERWSSPLYLFGESYGTTRSGGMAGYMVNRGIAFNGIVLLSMVLDFQSLEFARINDEPYPLILPSYTEIAAYHKRLAPELMQDMSRTRREVTQWVMNTYWPALNKGDAMSPPERQSIIDGIARYTGLPKDVIDRANLRIDVQLFTKYLLADKGLRVGRLDGRYALPEPQEFFSPFSFSDPASSETTPPFTMAFNDYVRRELGYKVDMPYYVSGGQSGVFQWGASPRGQNILGDGYQDTAQPLREALVKDPSLKVLVMEGYYDLATPFLAADYTMDHLDLPADYRKNISFTQYESGHMVYLDEKSHDKMKRDFVNFIDATSKR